MSKSNGCIWQKTVTLDGWFEETDPNRVVICSTTKPIKSQFEVFASVSCFTFILMTQRRHTLNQLLLIIKGERKVAF